MWHLDLTQVRVLWLRYQVAAIIDGHSRMIVALQAYKNTPTTDAMLGLIDTAAKQHEKPRFLITDRGGQFQHRFRKAIKSRGITHTRGQPRNWQFNAKVERLFWSLKRWCCCAIMPFHIQAIQERLDQYAAWHNRYRPHAALGRSTPFEAAHAISRPDPIRFTQRGELEPAFTISRQQVGDDPQLLYPVITVRAKPCFAA